MKTQNKSQLVLKIMNLLFWIVFIGLCIKTGVILVSLLATLFLNTVVINQMPHEINLTELKNIGLFNHLNIGLVLIISSALKTYIAFLAIKISMRINLQQPFNRTICNLIEKLSYFAVIIGILQACGQSYYKGLVKEGLVSSNLSGYFGDGGEFLFLAGIIFIIAQVFKRGLEIQNENELTI